MKQIKIKKWDMLPFKMEVAVCKHLNDGLENACFIPTPNCFKACPLRNACNGKNV